MPSWPPFDKPCAAEAMKVFVELVRVLIFCCSRGESCQLGESTSVLSSRAWSVGEERGGGGGGFQKSTSLTNVAAGTSLQDVLRCLVLKEYTKGLASFSRVAMWLFFNLFCPERSLSETI